MPKKGILYLIPTPITEDDDCMKQLPAYNLEIIKELQYFVVENLRSARRFISKCKLGLVIDDLKFEELNEHTNDMDIERLIQPLLNGQDCGIMSEAGVPAIADPGADLVAIAHRHDIRVVPLVGPSSIIMSLMASGMNGQSFAFNGYLPVKPDQRVKRLKELSRHSIQNNQSQIFIEAPYRNEALVKTLLETLPASQRLTIAINICSKGEYIRTYTIEKWKKEKIDALPLKKNATIYVLG